MEAQIEALKAELNSDEIELQALVTAESAYLKQAEQVASDMKTSRRS